VSLKNGVPGGRPSHYMMIDLNEFCQQFHHKNRMFCWFEKHFYIYQRLHCLHWFKIFKNCFSWHV